MARKIFQALDRLVLLLSRLLVVVAGLGVLAGTLLGTAHVFGLRVLSRPIRGTFELTEAFMVVIVFGALAYVERRDQHIAVDIVYKHFPARVQWVCRLLARLLSAVFFGLVAWRGWTSAMASYRIGESASGGLGFPVAPFKFVLAISAALMVVAVLSGKKFCRTTTDDVVRSATDHVFEQEDVIEEVSK